MSRKGSIESELRQRGPAIGFAARRKHFEAIEKGGSLGPSMRLDVADHDIDAGSAQLTRRLEHGERLPDASGRPEEELETALRSAGLLFLGTRQQCFRVRPVFR